MWQMALMHTAHMHTRPTTPSETHAEAPQAARACQLPAAANGKWSTFTPIPSSHHPI